MNVGSNSDTYVNNTRLLKGEEAALEDGDELKLRGTYIFFFKVMPACDLRSWRGYVYPTLGKRD